MVGFRLFPLRLLIASHDFREIKCNIRAKWDVIVFSRRCGAVGAYVLERVGPVLEGFLRFGKLHGGCLENGDSRSI